MLPNLFVIIIENQSLIIQDENQIIFWFFTDLALPLHNYSEVAHRKM